MPGKTTKVKKISGSKVADMKAKKLKPTKADSLKSKQNNLANKGEKRKQENPTSETVKNSPKPITSKRVKREVKVNLPSSPAVSSPNTPKQKKLNKKGLKFEKKSPMPEVPKDASKVSTAKKGKAVAKPSTAAQLLSLNVSEQKKFKKKTLKLKKKVKGPPSKRKYNARGAIYLSRMPHGFAETGMKKYFSQFGDITQLRLARSKKTCNSMGYAYIEFADSDVARIVAETMDNYLMFGKLMKCEYIPPKKVNKKMFMSDVTEKMCPRIINRRLNVANLNKQKIKGEEERVKQQRLKRYRAKIDHLNTLGVNVNVTVETNDDVSTAVKEISEKKSKDKETDEDVSTAVKEISEKKSKDKKATSEAAIADKINQVNLENIIQDKLKLYRDGIKPTPKKTSKKFVLEVNESEEEVSFKTPPNATKVVRRSSKRISNKV